MLAPFDKTSPKSRPPGLDFPSCEEARQNYRGPAMAQNANRKCSFHSMPNEAQLLAPGGHEVRQPDACLASRHRGGVWVAEGGVGTEPFRTLCPLSDPRLSPPDSSFRQLCPLATAYLPDKWPHCPARGRAVCVLQSPPGSSGRDQWVRTWASARRPGGQREIPGH